MKVTDLYLKIEKLQNLLNERIPELNYGGCGWFAFEVGKKLKKLGVKFSIVTMDSERSCEDYESRKKSLHNIRNNKEFGETSFSHCYLKIENLIFDGHYSNGVFRKEFAHLNDSGNYSLFDTYLALKKGGWNYRFNLQKNLPILKETIEEVFSKK